MSLRVYTGLPASGKTSAIIAELEQRRKAGRDVLLILSSEHEELTRRPNVRPQGLMGCRDKTKSFPIDQVIDSQAAAELLGQQKPGTLVVFDEAQYFQPQLVKDWQKASERGVDILIGTPSDDQLRALETVPHELIHLKVACTCGTNESSHVVYEDNLVYPTHLCDPCYVGFKAKPTSPREFDDLSVTNARQTSDADGHWSDDWVGRKLEVGLQALGNSSSLRIEGWRPDDSKRSTIAVSVAGKVIHTNEIGAGLFELVLDVNLAKDDFFELKITNSEYFRPDNDARQLSFVLRALQFS